MASSVNENLAEGKAPKQRKIHAAEPVGSALVITFDDGKTAAFDADYLYRHADENGNRTIPTNDEGGAER
jgi:hypothetical protein